VKKNDFVVEVFESQCWKTLLFSTLYRICWWRWRPPLMLILLKNILTQPFLPPFLPPNDRLRQADFLFMIKYINNQILYLQGSGWFYLEGVW